MAKDKKNILRLRRGRTVGIGLIVIMGILIFGIVFVDEPLSVQITDDFDLEICPPYCIPAIIPIPPPTFEPKIILMTPIFTTIDDLGNEDVKRGQGTFLEEIAGFTITSPFTNATFDNGILLIDLEFDTQSFEQNTISVIGILDLEKVTFFPPPDVTCDALDSILSDTCPPPPAGSGIEFELQESILFSSIGITQDGIFTTNIFDRRIDSFAESGTNNYDFVIKDTTIQFSFAEFQLLFPARIGGVTFTNQIVGSEIVDLDVNGTDIVIVEDVIEDISFVPCPLPVLSDSISILFPSIEISGTNDIWDKTSEGFDIINVDIRNNRNCDLTLAIGSQWQRVNGEILKSEIEEFLVPTNSTIPLSSIQFDSESDCIVGSGSCSCLFFG